MKTKHLPKINFIDLHVQQSRIRARIHERIQQVLDHGKYIMGPEVAELEDSLASYAGVKHCVTCASGTDALLMALMAYDIGPGDAVFTTPFTFISTVEVILLLGATPVFADIEPDTFNIDVDKLHNVVERMVRDTDLKPRGITAVDLFGQPADYDAIRDVARNFDLFVLEDAAQSFGAEYRNQKAGNLGDIAATSFFPAKPLGCYGDGGAVFTHNDKLASKIRSIRVHGKGSHKYENERIGINGRLDTIQAAILLEKLEIFNEEVELRNRIANRYSQGLRNDLLIPGVKPDRTSVWAQYSVLSDRREELTSHLNSKGIPTAIYYPKPLHLQTALKALGHRQGDYPISERVAGEIFSLPMHPYLSEEQQNFIIQTVNQA